MPSQNLTIAADADDGMENQFGWGSGGGLMYVNPGDPPSHAGMSFVLATTIPAGATITKAYLRMYCQSDAATITPSLRIENVDPASQTQWNNSGHAPSTATPVGSGHSPGSVAFAVNNWYFGESDNNPVDMASSIQTLLNTYGPLASGGRINPYVIGTAGSGSTAFQDSNNGTNDAELFIEWSEASGEPVPLMAQACF